MPATALAMVGLTDIAFRAGKTAACVRRLVAVLPARYGAVKTRGTGPTVAGVSKARRLFAAHHTTPGGRCRPTRPTGWSPTCGPAGCPWPADSMPLNPWQQQFVAGYLTGLPASEAYRQAGYTCRTANAAQVKAYQILRHPLVAAAVEAGRQQAQRAADLSAADVLRGLHAEATRFGDGSSHSARVTAWIALGKHLGMFKDKIEVSGPAGSPVQHDHAASGSVFDAIDKLTALFDAGERSDDGPIPAAA